MSLINDAIKKANQANRNARAQQQTGESKVSAANVMQEAGTAVSPTSVGTTGMFLIAGVVILVLIGGFLMVIGLRNRPVSAGSNASDRNPPTMATDSIGRSPATTPPSEPAGNAALPTADQNGAGVALKPLLDPSTPAVVEPEITVVPTFPSLKLQGIFYQPEDPTVMINGTTLWVGDEIEGAVVSKIDRSGVTIDFNGETRVLRIR